MIGLLFYYSKFIFPMLMEWRDRILGSVIYSYLGVLSRNNKLVFNV